MKLTAQVVGLEHGGQFIDKKPRVSLRVTEIDSALNSTIKVPVESLDGWVLGQMHDLTLAGWGK